MKLLCNIGMHSWDGCKCSNCGKIKDENHSWDGCKCSNCGKIKDENHTWKKEDCSQCLKCGKLNLENHIWDGCKCSNCGKIKDENHSFDGCKCSNCEKIIDINHSWTGCICVKCGKIKDENHSVYGCECSYCGKTFHALKECLCQNCNQIIHNWQNGKCTRCKEIHLSRYGETDLMLALIEGRGIKEISDLCSNGLVNISNFQGWTPLMKAVNIGYDLEVVKLLLSYGADINAENKFGDTAVQCAALRGKEVIVEYLFSHGAKGGFVIQDQFGKIVKRY